MTPDSRPILVTGGAGFIGCNIAHALAAQGHEIIIYDALSRPGVETNLAWLQDSHPGLITPVIADIRDEDELAHAARDAKAVFHMAAQVAVTTSLADPREDFEINLRGTVNLLDALRLRADRVPVIFASTNKVYGDLADIDFRLEGTATCPPTMSRGPRHRRNAPARFPHALWLLQGRGRPICARLRPQLRSAGSRAADELHLWPPADGHEDQGWVAHFLIRAIEDEPITLYGDGCQVRDILDVSNAVDAYLSSGRGSTVQGPRVQPGGGPDNAVSLRELLAYMSELLGREIEISYSDWRAGDQRYFVADTRAARDALDLSPAVPWRQGVAALADWLREARGLKTAPRPGARRIVRLCSRPTPSAASGNMRPISPARSRRSASSPCWRSSDRLPRRRSARPRRGWS
jgi:CDP-paratose 2-epimerase